MSQINEKSLEAAARALVDHTPGLVGYGSMTLSITTPQALVAISAFLQAEAARGFQMMPREPSEAMHIRGMDVRRVQDNLNKVHSVIIDTSEIWREMFAAAGGGKP